jgi:chorismate--pyruvate lyase
MPAAEEWVRLDECLRRAPAGLHPWLAEPGLLTARVRRACGEATQLTLIRLEPAALGKGAARRLGVGDATCLVREIEFSCGDARWIFAQSLFPDSTVGQHPWLAQLGASALGVSLLGRHDVSREPLEYCGLPPDHELAIAAGVRRGQADVLWARRAVYQLSGAPILVQEVFLPSLGQRGAATGQQGSST